MISNSKPTLHFQQSTDTVESLLDNHTITIKRARQLLGKSSSDKLSDNQVIDLLLTLQLMARQQLGYNGSKNEHTH